MLPRPVWVTPPVPTIVFGTTYASDRLKITVPLLLIVPDTDPDAAALPICRALPVVTVVAPVYVAVAVRATVPRLVVLPTVRAFAPVSGVVTTSVPPPPPSR